MSTKASISERMPPWQRLGHFDGLVVEGVDYRVQSSDVRGQLLYETSRPSITAFFDHRRWEDIRKAPGFQLRPGYHDPKHAATLRLPVSNSRATFRSRSGCGCSFRRA